MANVYAVVSVIGKDQKGVVAQFATYLAERGVNIDDLQQHVVHGLFMMDMLVELSEVSVSLDKLITELLALGKEIHMEVRVTLQSDRRKRRVGVLATKEPHCLERLIADWKRGELGGEIDCVLSNHETLRGIVEAAGIEFLWMPSTDKEAHMAWLLETLKKRQIDLVVLARYMQVLTAEVVNAFEHKIINIHPSLLPHFPGPSPYRRAHEQGVRVSGSTAHFVTADLDEGPIVLQDVFQIDTGKDTVEDVKENGAKLEAKVLSQAVKYALNEQLVVVDGRVVFKPGLTDLFSGEREG